jgi:hypothetical protein
MVDLVNSLMLVALGFVPTFVALETAWRMGKMVGKRGGGQEEEKTFAWRYVRNAVV